MKVLTNVDFLTNISGFENINEPVNFYNSDADSLQDFIENSPEGTYFEDEGVVYYKIRNTDDDCIVFDDDENVI